MKCPKCQSKHIWKYGKTKTGRQDYKCGDCFCRFTKSTIPGFLRMRFPPDVITYAQKLVYYYGLSTWKTAKLLRDFGIDVSHDTIHTWCYEEFTDNLEELKKEFKKELTGIWYVDETFVRVKGKDGYLWVVKDSNHNVIALYLSKRRNAKSAEKAMLLAYERAGFKPHTVVTDGYTVYPTAVKTVFPKAEHVPSGIQGINEDHLLSMNEVEGYNGKFKTDYHIRRGFKNWKNARIYVSKYELYNHFMNNEQLDVIRPSFITV